MSSTDVPEEFLNLSENKQKAALALLEDKKADEGASDSPA